MPPRANATTLVTIGFSHFCEKARWALQRAGIAFVEVAQPPGLHVAAVRRIGGQHSTPCLRLGNRIIEDSTLILDAIHAHPGATWRPWSTADEEPAVRRFEAMFDVELGAHVRRVMYHHLLEEPALLVQMCQQRSSLGSAVAFRRALPFLGPLMRKGMDISAASAAASLQHIRNTCDDVDAQLEDGRRYLVGASFTAADLTLASLLSPLTMTTQVYDLPMSALPAPLAALVESFRERPCGRFVQRVYDDERSKVIAA